MLKNYLNIAIRNLLKYKTFSLLNIFGLSIGITCFLLIAKYATHEYSFDRFHKNAEDIYMVYGLNHDTNRNDHFTPDPLVTVLKNDYPELKNVVSISESEQPVRITENLFLQDVYMANQEIFEMFSFELVLGSREKIDDGSHSIVISKGFAAKHFRKEDPRGEVIYLKEEPFTVTGVMGNIPSNSSIQMDLLIFPSGMLHFEPDFFTQWWSWGSMTFVHTSKDFTPELLESQLPFIVDKYFPDYLKGRTSFSLMPLNNMHISGEVDSSFPSAKPISPSILYVLITIALAILLIACFNFINLSISRSVDRSKEIGIRKVIGATKRQLLKQFLGETALITVLALGLGCFLTYLALPYFNQLTERSLSLIPTNYPLEILFLTVLGIFTVLVAGFYPAFYVSSSKPAVIIKTKNINPDTQGLGIRKFLVVSQFVIATILISSVMLIYKQTLYMDTRELGFDKANVIALELNSWQVESNFQKLERVRDLLISKKETLGLESIALSEHVPQGSYQNHFKVYAYPGSPETSQEMIVTSIDESFIDTYGLSLLVGRNFSSALASDKVETVILNKTAARMLGMNYPLEKPIKFKHDETPLQVIGIIEDFHFQSLHRNIAPQVYRYAGDEYTTRFLSVSTTNQKSAGVVQFLNETWKEIVPELPFEYVFIADEYAKGYKQDIKTAKIIGVFSMLAILLACLGLLGLISHTITNRTKEIGIRKVLGATISQIVATFTRGFFKLLLAASLIAIPISWYAVTRWLDTFAYQTKVSWWLFVLAGLLVLAVAGFTISFQSIKAALANPVDSLKME